MICDICGKHGAEIHYVARNYGKGANLLIIENVPVVSCPHCGESYLTAATVSVPELLKILEHLLPKE
jgi:YgiT-type zinc finger domain-containing protein